MLETRWRGMRLLGRGGGRAVASLLLAATPLVGCSSHCVRLDQPIPRSRLEPEDRADLVPAPGSINRASIGEIVLTVRRYTVGREVVSVEAPFPLLPFPADATLWAATLRFEGDDAAGQLVYTCDQYYKGTVGVMLDDAERLAAKRPVIQLDGAREGRRWGDYPGTPPFFVRETTVHEFWGLRYGGKQGESLTFEIVTSPDARVPEVQQTIHVSLADGKAGTVIRGVEFTLEAEGDNGIIAYKVRNAEAAP